MYFDPSKPSGFSSAKVLYQYAKKVLPGIKFKDVQSFLERSNTYTSFKNKKQKFKRRVIERGYVDSCWAIDTMFFLSISAQNGGYSSCLVCLDIFSMYVWAKPTRTKQEKEMGNAFKSIIAENHGVAPEKAWTDSGTDLAFLNKTLKDLEITRYSSNNREIKSSLVERVILDLKRNLMKFMFQNSTLRWVDDLSKVVFAHNQKKSVFGFSPAECRLPQNYEIIKSLWRKRKIQYEKQFYHKKPSFKVNDLVKIRKKKTQFSRGFTEKNSPHTYRILRAYKTYPTVYSLANDKGVTVKKRFYEDQLVKASPVVPRLYIAETEELPMNLRSGRKKESQKRYKIKDHSDISFSKWVDAKQLKEMKLLENFEGN